MLHLFRWFINLFRKKKTLAEFASLDGQNQSIPTSGASADRLQLTTPNSMITGTMAGLQQIGSPSLTVDSVKNLITVKPISTANTQILRYGQVATGFLGMAVNDGTNDTMFAGQDNTGATVVKIAKSGFDAKTATAANLIFNSSQDTFKIVSAPITVPLSFTLNSTNATFGINKVPHGLTFTPAYIAFITVDSAFASLTDAGTANIPNPFTVFTIVGSAMNVSLNAWVSVDATNINFEIQTRLFGTSTVVNSAKVYLLQETAT